MSETINETIDEDCDDSNESLKGYDDDEGLLGIDTMICEAVALGCTDRCSHRTPHMHNDGCKSTCGGSDQLNGRYRCMPIENKLKPIMWAVGVIALILYIIKKVMIKS